MHDASPQPEGVSLAAPLSVQFNLTCPKQSRIEHGRFVHVGLADINCGLVYRIFPLDEQPFYSMRSKMVEAFLCHHFFRNQTIA